MWLCKNLGTEEAAWHHKGGPTSLQSLQGNREEHQVGGAVVCGELLEEASVRVSDKKKTF